jgi:hypothetical protein
MSIAFPWAGGTALATGMGQLYRWDSPLLADKSSDLLQPLDVLVVVDTGILWTDATFWRNGSRFHHDQPRPTDSSRAEMHEVPVAEKAVIRRILTHRSNSHSISQNNIFKAKIGK